MYFHYNSSSWFLDGNCSPALVHEVDYAIQQMIDLINSNSSTNPAELVWLHSYVRLHCFLSVLGSYTVAV